MRILLSVPGFTEASLFDTSARDGVQYPFIALRQSLSERGHELITPDTWDGLPVDAFLAWDMPPQSLYETLVWYNNRYQPIRKVLITGEPPVVRLDNWDTNLHNLFNIVLTWNDALVDNVFYRKFHWPQTDSVGDFEDVPFAARKLITHISGNKYSSVLGELYTLRKQAVKYFEKCIPTQFDLYGVGWDAREWPSYQGAPPHKVDVYPHYKFALVYENMIAPGWITEKLFDALRGGLVPVYWGASNIEQYVDPACYVDVRQFQNLDMLTAYLMGMDAATWQGYRGAANAYLSSERFTPFTSAAFVDTVSAALGIE